MLFRSTLPDGTPLARTLHPIVVGDTVWFHGRATGEKARTVGRAAVVTTESVICRLPSYVFDAERACPATTWFEAVEVRGEVVRAEGEEKARILQAMMESYQPEGGYVPITATDPRYRQSVDKLLLFGVRGEVRGRVKVGQGKPEAVLAAVNAHLWKTGEVGALARVLQLFPERTLPPVLTLDGLRFDVAPTRVPLELLRDLYWNVGIPDARLEAAHRGSTAWLTVLRGDRIVASARAVADGAKFAWIYDVVVAEDCRGHGLGKALMRALLDHAAVRDCARVLLGTRDAMDFYRDLGFVPRAEARRRPYVSTEMVLERELPIGPVV